MSTPDDRLSGLVERLEKASGPLRELDVLIFGLAVDLVDGKPWSDADLEYAASAPERTCNAPRFTSSIDAAMTLVPPHADFELGSAKLLNSFYAVLYTPEAEFKAKACPSLAIALCAAALKSRSPQP